MYTSFDYLMQDERVLIEGFSDQKLYPLEPLFLKYGVDVYLFGHAHAYERNFPVYGGLDTPIITFNYTDPFAPIHILRFQNLLSHFFFF